MPVLPVWLNVLPFTLRLRIEAAPVLAAEDANPRELVPVAVLAAAVPVVARVAAVPVAVRVAAVAVALVVGSTL